jgi:hypothetical protein
LAGSKTILRYLKGTLDFGMFYSKSAGKVLYGYSNSDRGGDQDERKSTTGHVFFLGSTAFTWISKK